MALSAAAGGYAAYKYGGDGIVTYYNNGERKHLKAADAAIGALTGFTISYIMNALIFKPNDSEYLYSEDEYKKWIRKANLDDKYNFLKSDESNLTIIDKGYESNFQVHNDTDIEDFQKAFPNSSYLDDVLGKSIKNVSRNQLYALIRKYPNSKNINRMTKQYIETSRTLLEFYQNYYTYPNVGVTNKSGIISTLLNKTSRNSLPNIISVYSKDDDIDKLKEYYFANSQTLVQLYDAKDKYSKYNFSSFKSKLLYLLPNTKRKILKNIVSKYPKDEYVKNIKKAYIDKSLNVNQLLEAKYLYKDILYNYNKKALYLLDDLKDLDTYAKIVDFDYLERGKKKIDDKMWEEAKKKNTKDTYKYYLNNSPQKLYADLANQKIELIEQKEKERLEKERLAKIQKEKEERERYENKWKQVLAYLNDKQIIGKSGYYNVTYTKGIWKQKIEIKVEFIITDVFGKVEKYNKSSLNNISCEVSIRDWSYEGNWFERAVNSDSRIKYEMDKKIGTRMTLKYKEMIIYGFNYKN